MPDPILVGRDKHKLEALCKLTGFTKMSVDLAETLKDPGYSVYFDAQTTGRRAEADQAWLLQPGSIFTVKNRLP